jgi:hypothetical protein
VQKRHMSHRGPWLFHDHGKTLKAGALLRFGAGKQKFLSRLSRDIVRISIGKEKRVK